MCSEFIAFDMPANQPKLFFCGLQTTTIIKNEKKKKIQRAN